MFRRYGIVVCLATSADAAEKDAKTISLFNGKDLSDWTTYQRGSSAKLETAWSVEDGVIICKGSPAGYIRTKNGS